MENIGKVHKYLEKYNAPKLNREKIKTWLSLTITKRQSSNEKIQGPDGFTGQFL